MHNNEAIAGAMICSTSIDSGASRSFITPSCVTLVGLKSITKDVFLELGNGENFYLESMFWMSL